MTDQATKLKPEDKGFRDCAATTKHCYTDFEILYDINNVGYDARRYFVDNFLIYFNFYNSYLVYYI